MNEETIGGLIAGAIIVAFVGFLFWFFPMYGMWCNQLDVKTASYKGQAKLMKANQDRQIKITEAETGLKAMQFKQKTMILQAEADSKSAVIRAEGASKANKILNASLTPQVLQSQYIKALPAIKGNLYFTNGNSMPAVMLK